ncbi:Tetratricopeptide repeat protein [compost metagenome]
MIYQHMFAEMNEMLDEIARFYHIAQGDHKKKLMQQWNLLKHMSDGIIEEWLCFEEKMAYIRQNWKHADQSHAVELPEMQCGAFIKGQGYYKLLMFPQALGQFKLVMEEFPESVLSQTFLGMCHMQLEEMSEAVKHFWFVLEHAESRRMRSIVYNALGCIEANRGARDKAEEYFKLAHHHDPSLAEPLANLEACMQCSGKLQYGTELTSLL